MTTQTERSRCAGRGLVHVDHLTKHYRKTPALRDYSLSLDAGHIVGLMGPNGCGKTTLLKILAGVLSDYEGTVTIGGCTPGVATKEIVSYLPDADFLNADWTAEEAIRVYSMFFADFDADKAASMVDFFGLPSDRRLGEMSKGMGEKLQISLIMSRRARVFLLDEPISGVDPATRDIILEGILREFNPESLLIMSTHLISDIEHFVDYALFMKEGQVLLQGDADDLRATHGDSLDAIFRKEYR
ncbi:MAG: ABC transporter ATP-binding protein [Actinomyces sp.]|uniref:ABC transporter ATP-binding protein n=1 Tax=Actinomyces sp. TaxID=29317 RepID=UPI0025F7CD3B|nr:ABC transporter ATP-binding protein [Actinomyces sp.]MDU1430371.1 ABC transporter ATP-binding protein [Actinomyces sp.]